MMQLLILLRIRLTTTENNLENKGTLTLKYNFKKYA